MKRITTALVTLSVVLMATTGSATTPQSVEVTRNLTSMPLAFTENQGQWDEQVLYRANAGGATMWFTSGGAVYQFTRRVPRNSVIASESRVARDERGNLMQYRGRQTPSSAPDRVTPSAVEGQFELDSIESIAIKANFVGSNPNPRMVGLDEMDYKCNYFLGNDPNEWHTDVPNYNAIVYEDIYSGIDLKYYGNGKQMEYDFIVSPGADFSQIEIQYEGAESVSINENGELVVTTEWGEVIEQRPVIYQLEKDRRIPVEGIYRLQGDNSFGFELGSDYDPAKPVVIDPILRYSTYLGGNYEDHGYGIAVDGSGSAFVTGLTFSSDFPTEVPYQTEFQGGYRDVFVTKLNSSGNGLIYSTYLGGSDRDYGYGIAVDENGSAFVTGQTRSSDFPTENPYQTDLGGHRCLCD